MIKLIAIISCCGVHSTAQQKSEGVSYNELMLGIQNAVNGKLVQSRKEDPAVPKTKKPNGQSARSKKTQDLINNTKILSEGLLKSVKDHYKRIKCTEDLNVIRSLTEQVEAITEDNDDVYALYDAAVLLKLWYVLHEMFESHDLRISEQSKEIGDWTSPSLIDT